MVQQELKISCCTLSPPVGALLTLEYLNSYITSVVEWSKTTLLEVNGVSFTSDIVISRYLSRLVPERELYGKTILQKTEVDHWLEFAISRLSSSEFKEAILYLNEALTSVTYLVGHSVTIADLCLWGSLCVSEQWHKAVSCCLVPKNVIRWYSFLASQDEFLSVMQSLPKESQVTTTSELQNTEGFQNETPNVDKIKSKDNAVKQNSEKDRGKFVDLPGAEMEKVVVRFPPEASGYLHIGHAKAALLNQHYQKTFEGKLIMRFDDTNPAKEKEDFEKVILEDIAMLEIKPDHTSYTSDWFEFILEKCEYLINLGKAYLDDTNPEVMKLEREQRKESKNRNNSIEKNMQMWSEMLSGSEYGQQCCVRAKIDINSDNGCLRDPTLYRCKNEHHPKTGKKYKVYPTYDFACPIVDSIEGVTHALRTTEYHDRDEQYFWILEQLDLRKPYIYEYSRLNMMNTVLSKRKLTWFVEQSIVGGWDDPRMPTVRGILRRGMTVEGLKQFIVAQGSSRSVVIMEWDKIWAFNKKIIDVTSPRYSAVEKGGSIPVYVIDAKEEFLQVPKHPKNPDLGTKTICVGPKLLIDYSDAEHMKEGENVTFISWGNLLISSIKRKGGTIECIEARLNLENKDYKKTFKVTWLADCPQAPPISCVCIYYDHLISKPILGKDEDFKNFLGENTKIEVPMYGDSELANLKKAEIIQLQRKGFFICDQPYDSSTARHIGRESPLVLISIPDGSKDTTTLPQAVLKLRLRGESTKELSQRSKDKAAEKSPQDDKSVAESFIELYKSIETQGDKIRLLKSTKAAKNVIDSEVQILLKLKKNFKTLTGKEWKPEMYDLNKQGQIKIEESGNVPPPLCETSSESLLILDQQILLQGDKIRKMKAEKTEKYLIDPEVQTLLKLKSNFKELTGKEWKPDQNVSAKDKCKNLELSDSPSKMELEQEIKIQGDKVRKLKSEKVPKEILDREVQVLLKLKNDFKLLTGVEWKPAQQTILQPKKTEQLSSQPIHFSEAAITLDYQIKLKGDTIRKMKSEKVSKDILDPEIKCLLKLKAEFKLETGIEWKPQICDVNSRVENSNKEHKTTPNNECNKKIGSGDNGSILNQALPTKVNVDHPDCVALKVKIDEQGEKIRILKTKGALKDYIENEVQALLSLKVQYKDLTGIDLTKGNDKKKAKKEKSPQGNVTVEAKDDIYSSGVKKITRLGMEAKKEENLADWYSQVITKGELIEYYDVSGCYVIRPWAYAIWEEIKAFFDPKIKALGVQNCYFPMFVSLHALEKEKTHIADFAPEVAWVTKSGNSDLAEPIAIRPTSETVMYPSYAKWIKSHRDLPLQLNQWCNVVRWEFKHPQPFLRTREFLWQEGHTAFATQKEAEEEVHTIIKLYADIYEKLLAIPVIQGRKTEKEKFAGGDFTFTIEAYISASGRAIQGGTSHHLGQNFSKMFEIVYEDPETGKKNCVYQNSWGLTTRTIGVMVMTHGDNTGLILPPYVASYQVVIVPCGITANLSENEKQDILIKCKELEMLLEDAKIKVKGDYRDNYSPGWKFNHWELKGVPVRIEIGPRDCKNKQFVAVRRDTGEKLTFIVISAVQSIKELLENIHQNLYKRALADLENHLKVSYDWNDFCTKLDDKCIIQAPFCGEIPCEDKIKKDSAKDADEQEIGASSMGAKSLCIPFQQVGTVTAEMTCIHPQCRNKPKYYTLFGRSY